MEVSSCSKFSPTKTHQCNIQVVCRVRPLLRSEIENGCRNIVAVNEDTATINLEDRQYTFDKVFPETSTQEQVHNGTAKALVDDVLQGFNATLFVYGMTSSGKTHTMEGIFNDQTQYGIVPRVSNDIFEKIEKSKHSAVVIVSNYEIYLDSVKDLLDSTNKHLTVREDSSGMPHVQGKTERQVFSREAMLAVFEQGRIKRSVASTELNNCSSRSHSVFDITINQKLEDGTNLFSRLCLVDLAGSEKVSRTKVAGSALNETKQINKSLHALGQVVSALASGAKFIPYRNSKLTRILQQSLGGNSRTIVVVCISPASVNEEESQSTLQFGCRAKKIKNHASINKDINLTNFTSPEEKFVSADSSSKTVKNGAEESNKLQWSNTRINHTETRKSILEVTSEHFSSLRRQNADLRCQCRTLETAIRDQRTKKPKLSERQESKLATLNLSIEKLKSQQEELSIDYDAALSELSGVALDVACLYNTQNLHASSMNLESSCLMEETFRFGKRCLQHIAISLKKKKKQARISPKQKNSMGHFSNEQTLF